MKTPKLPVGFKPHLVVTHYGFFAFFNEAFHAIFFDGFPLVSYTKKLLNLKFHW